MSYLQLLAAEFLLHHLYIAFVDALASEPLHDGDIEFSFVLADGGKIVISEGGLSI